MSDFRALLTPRGGRSVEKLNQLFGVGDITNPLFDAKGLYFPYTPTIQVSGNADYEEYTFTHAIYKYNAYSKSYLSEIILTCDFTSQTEDEAKHTLACMHFFRSVTKSYFGTVDGPGTAGTDDKSGVPPPVINFSYLGDQMFQNVPVIIKNYTYVLPSDVDYVPVTPTGGAFTDGRASSRTSYVPASITLTITMDVNHNPKQIRDTFNLDHFKNGDLLDQGFI